MNDFLGTVEAFSAFSPDEIQRLAQAAQIREYDFGQTIAEAGEQVTALGLVLSGKVRLLSVVQGKETSIEVVERGGTFNELSILRPQPAEYTARAAAKCTVLLFKAELFQPFMASDTPARRFLTNYLSLRAGGGFLSQIFALRTRFKRQEIEELVRQVGIKSVEAGQVVLEQDSTSDQRLYIVRRGQMELCRRGQEDEQRLAILNPGESFGEKSCLEHLPQPWTARATRQSVLIVVPQKVVHQIIECNPMVRKALEERAQFLEREAERLNKLAQRRRGGFIFDLTSRPRRGEKVLRNFPLVEQAEEMDCGAACLAMICRHHDLNITLGKVRDMVGVTTEGATMEALARAGESLGFITRGVKATYKVLLTYDLPFIAHWQGYHFVVVYGISPDKVWLADPGEGFKQLSAAQFEQGWTGNCLLFTPGQHLARQEAGVSPWPRFLGYLRPFRKVLLDLLLCALILQVLGLAPPIMIQNILDRVVVHSNHSLLNLMVLGLAITMLFSEVSHLVSSFLANFMVRHLDQNMMTHFCRHVLALPLSFFVKRQTGDIMARFAENETIRLFMTESSISSLMNSLMVFVYFAVMLAYDVKLTLILLLFVPPVLGVSLLATSRYKDLARKQFLAKAAEESLLMETLSGIETVKAMGVERPLRLKWEKKYAATMDIRYRTAMFSSWVGITSELLKGAGSLALLWIGSRMVLSGELTIGQLMAFNALMGSVMAPLLGLVGIWDELQQALVSMERLGDVLDTAPEQRPQEAMSRVLLPDLKGDIRLRGVFFRYQEQGPHILKNLNLEIEAGTTVAVVGPSGSGKTTLARLLVGFYRPSEGTIFVDGYDLANLDLEYYRAQIGYVMQNNVLFSGTVADNIAITDPYPNQARLEEVAQMADAHSFIKALPLGYQQVIGERGSGLSGGQIQRICIARALYHQPRLIILDEATSSLDTESEGLIQANLEKILLGRTGLVIAHRLSTVMRADRILVLYEGAVVEDGNHRELLAKKGMYYHLVQKQMASDEVLA